MYVTLGCGQFPQLWSEGAGKEGVVHLPVGVRPQPGPRPVHEPFQGLHRRRLAAPPRLAKDDPPFAPIQPHYV